MKISKCTEAYSVGMKNAGNEKGKKAYVNVNYIHLICIWQKTK